MSSANLSGHWIGHYVQRGQSRSITADLLQVGQRLSGSMRDGQPDQECSLYEASAAAGLQPGADEEIEAKLREMVPDTLAGPVRWVSHLPIHSALEGTCLGTTVSFLKTYQGTSFAGYKVGKQLIGIEKAGHEVHYHGDLSPDSCQIDGRWWIDADPELGTPRTQGLFTLHRFATGKSWRKEQAPARGGSCPWWRFWQR